MSPYQFFNTMTYTLTQSTSPIQSEIIAGEVAFSELEGGRASIMVASAWIQSFCGHWTFEIWNLAALQHEILNG
jgi:hypothetical protein